MDYQKRIQEIKDAAARQRDMRRLRTRGWTLERIGRKYGISRARVCQILGAQP